MRPAAFTGLRALAALALLAALAGCHQGKVYPLSPDAARSALVGTTIPDMAFGKSAHSDPGEATADAVAWRIVRGPAEEAGPPGEGDDEMMKLTATLAPVPGGVEVSVDIGARPGADPQAVAKALSQKPAVERYFRTIAREQVDSVLTRRPFRFEAISGDMAVAMVSMLPEIRKQMDDAAAAYERRDTETIHHAYDAAGQGGQ
jgi:predicted small lipoprotein YifL